VRLAAALAALLLGGCAGLSGLLSFSNDQVASMLPSHVNRMKLNDLSPEVARYLRRTYTVEFADANVTIVDDLLLRDLFAKARVLGNAAASFWDVRAVANSHLPSLPREILYELSQGEDSVLLVDASFAGSVSKREQLILVHECAHEDQYDKERYVRKGAGRIADRAPSMDAYLADPREMEAFDWEMRYAQTVLGMDLSSYLNVRFGFVVEQELAQALDRLWHRVEQPARSVSPAAEIGRPVAAN